MKTKLLFFCWLLFLPIASIAQNLVPNPSFEDTLPHANCITGIEIANHWFNPNAATPDLYSYKSSCGNSSINNPSGFQLPITGNCYAGIYTYLGSTREYIAVKLDSNLSNSCTYYIEFYVSRADKFGLGTDKLGAGFTNDTTGFKILSGVLPIIPAIQSPPGQLLTDTINWTKISGSYTANGSEQFFIIGNFYDNTNTYWDTVNTTGLLYGAYYYIDDIKILPCGMTNIKENNLDNIQIQYLNNRNELKISGNFESSEIEISQIDLMGQELFRKKIKNINNDEIIIELNKSYSGISLIILRANNFLITKKIM